MFLACRLNKVLVEFKLQQLCFINRTFNFLGTPSSSLKVNAPVGKEQQTKEVNVGRALTDNFIFLNTANLANFHPLRYSKTEEFFVSDKTVSLSFSAN